jgi:hypothetical protein
MLGGGGFLLCQFLANLNVDPHILTILNYLMGLKKYCFHLCNTCILCDNIFPFTSLQISTVGNFSFLSLFIYFTHLICSLPFLIILILIHPFFLFLHFNLALFVNL